MAVRSSRRVAGSTRMTHNGHRRAFHFATQQRFALSKAEASNGSSPEPHDRREDQKGEVRSGGLRKRISWLSIYPAVPILRSSTMRACLTVPTLPSCGDRNFDARAARRVDARQLGGSALHRVEIRYCPDATQIASPDTRRQRTC